MPIRLATLTDRPAIVTLYQASPLRAVYGPMSGIQSLFFDADSVPIVNDTGSGLNACILARADRTTRVHTICVVFMIATNLTAMASTIRQTATVGKNRGFGFMYGAINQKAPQLATARAYLEARWPYLDSPGPSPEYRMMGASLDEFIANA